MTTWATDAPTASALAADVRAGRADPVELVERALARAEECADPAADLGALVHVDADRARADARSPRPGPLSGVPVAVKDLFDVAGEQSRAGSRVPPGPAAAADSPAVARLRAAGAVVIGRTRTHEFAYGLTTQHAVLGGTANPYDGTRVPGGSSGGSAAAVAAGIVPLALGTDTGCSIRLPAAWCGLVGHKPTHGLVPLDGVVPLAPSLDHGGALVRDVADARLALEVLSGRRLPEPAGAGSVRLGVVRAGTASPDVAALLDAAAERAARLVATVTTVEQPLADRTPALYGVCVSVEALAWHRGTGRWPQHAGLYGRDVRLRLEAAEQITAEQAAEAALLREELRRRTAALFDEVDLLLMPVATAGPGRRDEHDLGATVDLAGERVPVRSAVLPWTVLANLCGLPACSVPAGLDADGLPCGVQVVGPPGADARVLELAGRLEGS